MLNNKSYICIKLLRVHHYVKNLLVFAPLLFSGEMLDLSKVTRCIIGFIAFCALSSAIYIINDINDVEKDRLHPKKCHRPLASGEISIKSAKVLVFILMCISIGFNAMVFSLNSTIVLGCYFLINVMYSRGLKNVPILDVSILTLGFVLRILYGGCITNIMISNWLYLTVIVVALYFSLGKRRNELRMVGNNTTRIVLKNYTSSFLNNSMNMCLTLANVFYSLWCMDEQTIAHYNSEHLIFTAPIVLLITLKYSFIIEGDSDGDPVEVLLGDKVLVLMVIAYLLTMFCILYI